MTNPSNGLVRGAFVLALASAALAQEQTTTTPISTIAPSLYTTDALTTTGFSGAACGYRRYSGVNTDRSHCPG